MALYFPQGTLPLLCCVFPKIGATRRGILAFCLLLLGAAPGLARETLPLDDGWRFFRGDPAGAERQAFDDSTWKTLSIPHDWSIEGPFSETAPTGAGGGFLPSGVGWYRKRFHPPASWHGKRVFVEFDGVMANGEVWLNGISLGKRPNGYVSFRYELTASLLNGPENVLCVRSDTGAQPASRWYTGAGIYRHVRLSASSPAHFDQWGNFVIASLDRAPDASKATLRLESTVVNQDETARTVRVRFSLPDKGLSSESASVILAPGQETTLQARLELPRPQLWDVDSPTLYTVRAELLGVDGPLDEETLSIGVRDSRFEASTGYWLNGRNLKIKGVCLHHDGGAFGAAVPLGIWKRRLGELKKIGVNAIRTSHNPVAPELLDLCDRLGLLVLSEYFDVWLTPKQPEDYSRFSAAWAATDARDTLRRDRNHPSIVAYSAGNEIHDTLQPESAKKTLATLLSVYHKEDPTRPVTQALFRPNRSGDYANGLADMLDVIGQNYRERELIAAWQANPARKILGTETKHGRLQWRAMRDTPAFAGQFLWTGVDYLGEARRWPQIASDYGLLDRTGGWKPRAYERASWWSAVPVLAVFRRVAEREEQPVDPGYETAEQRKREFLRQQQGPELLADWTPAELSAHEEKLEVYSNCEQVELFLNGRSLGEQSLPPDAAPRLWKVPFEPGLLRAVGRNGQTVVSTTELRTAGAPKRLSLSSDRTGLSFDADSVARIEATVVDAGGTRVPGAHSPLTFSLEGAGEIVAVDNGDSASHESFRGKVRSASQGRCIVFVRSTAAEGKILLRVSSPPLEQGSVELRTEDGGGD